jgi:hypothetical protein
MTPVYVALAIAALAVVAVLVVVTGRKKPRRGITALAGLAFAFVLAGILFGEVVAVGYALMGVGIILAVVDAVSRTRNQQQSPNEP